MDDETRDLIGRLRQEIADLVGMADPDLVRDLGDIVDMAEAYLLASEASDLVATFRERSFDDDYVPF